MNVPFLDLKQQNAALACDLTEAFRRVLDSGRYILGDEVERFERNAAVVVGTKHAIGVSSGTDAILLALMALDIQPGDEVISPSFTFFATAGCIARLGATPVFADSCPVCFNMDVVDVRRRITSRTKAIMPVHLFGQTADLDGIVELAQHYGLPVIEDAAQALGACHHGRQAGSMGTFGTFSFYPSKNLGAFGDAGLLVTNDDALAGKARLQREHGAHRKYFHQVIGGNFRMDALQAALLGVKLPYLEEYCTRRTANACRYSRWLGEIPGVSIAEGPCGPNESHTPAGRVAMVLPAPHVSRRHIWNQYTVRVIAGEGWTRPETPRDLLREFLTAHGIGSEIYYPQPMHMQQCFAAYGPQPALPVCEMLAREALSLPVYPELAVEQLETVRDAVAGFLREVQG